LLFAVLGASLVGCQNLPPQTESGSISSLLPTYTPWPKATSTGTRTGVPTAGPTATPQPTSTEDPLKTAGNPVRLRIPAIGVDAPVELVGMTPDRAMDVPKGVWNAGWYYHSVRPGEVGNSVITGHLDSRVGPAVFYNLVDVAPGDEIAVEYANGLQLTFVATALERYPVGYWDAARIADVNVRDGRPHLNLITCGGDWNQTTYTHRDVVYSVLKQVRFAAQHSGD
jgi:sortase (surface protein transpeptidase)